jgi:hypothetical protein
MTPIEGIASLRSTRLKGCLGVRVVEFIKVARDAVSRARTLRARGSHWQGNEGHRGVGSWLENWLSLLAPELAPEGRVRGGWGGITVPRYTQNPAKSLIKRDGRLRSGRPIAHLQTAAPPLRHVAESTTPNALASG